MPDKNGQNHGLKSLNSALCVLAFMARQSGPLALTDIARECGMPLSKAHRYLASFVAANLVKQESRSGHYDLGRESMYLGLAAIARYDFVNFAAEGLSELANETGMTVLLSVWGNEVATVVRWERGLSPTVTSMGLGMTLPLLNSATGKAFLAWGSKTALQKPFDTELRRAAREPTTTADLKPTRTSIKELVVTIREQGFASENGKFIPGLVAAAAPILDWQGEAQAIITLVGVDTHKIHPKAPEMNVLRSFCAGLSVQRNVA